MKLDILKCRDTYDNYKINKGEMLPSLPSKIAIIGKSGISGKTTILSNIINRDEYFNKDFKGDNIYMISGSINSDDKIKNIIKYKEIPPENIFTSIDDEVLEYIMEVIKEKYTDSIEDKKTPQHSLIIFDDISYDSKLSMHTNDKISEIVCNMRHYLTTTIFTAQKSTQLARVIRTNCIYFVIFKQCLSELENIMGDICYINKKQFKNMFNEATTGKHDFFICNLDAPPDKIYCKCGTDTNNEIQSFIKKN